MWKNTFLLIRRDKWKWLSFLGGYLLFLVVYWGSIWGIGSLPEEVMDSIGGDNAYALLMGVVRLGGVVPWLALGFFIYWAGEVKLEKTTIRPWLFWSFLLVCITLISYIGNDVIGLRIMRTHTLVQVASWKMWIYLGSGFLKMMTLFLLWPFMLAVWKKKSLWEGYKIALLDWKKDLGWVGLLTVLSIINRALSFAINHLPSTPVTLGMSAITIQGIILTCGYAIAIYFLAAWVAKKTLYS